ncbi:MAG: Hpt domain-containing protein [Chromatiaceae bacterium]|nr:Hpt domain-containing protein [Chromatiaceae bacterium]
MSVLNKTTFDTVLGMSKTHQAALLTMLRNMLKSADDTIEQLQQYARQQQREPLLQALHKLRGGYATLGAELLAERCRALEHALEEQADFDETSLTQVIAALRQTCDAIRLALPQPASMASSPHNRIDLQQLYTMLKQQNMQAVTVINTEHTALNQRLPSDIAQQLRLLVSELNFSAAADLLAPYLPNTASSGH